MSASDASDSSAVQVLPPSTPPSTISQITSKVTWAKLKRRIQEDPLVFVFLGLTVVALTRGMGAMMRDDKRKSQRMMRQRVAFQLLTVGAVVGGMYWRAYQSGALETRRTHNTSPAVDNRVYMTNGRNYDLPADAAAKAADGAEAGLEGFAPEGQVSTERELR